MSTSFDSLFHIDQPASLPLRILIVDNDAEAVGHLKHLLLLLGFDAAGVTDGAGGIEAMPVLQPDVVLCALDLPGAMSGRDVARAIRNDPGHAGTFLIALGDQDALEAGAIRDCGFNAFLSKPVMALDLLAQLRVAQKSSRTRRPGGPR